MVLDAEAVILAARQRFTRLGELVFVASDLGVELRAQKSMPRVVVIVQARIGSSRLPGKILKRWRGKTFLEHCLDRCLRIRGADDVVCATVDTADCDAIVELCRARGYRWFRGSETNAVNRYRLAANDAKADVVVRITSDCPIADLDVADQVIGRFLAGDGDLVTTNIPPSWPIGLDVEAMSIDALEEADVEANRAYDREHVSTFIRARPLRYRLSNIPCPLEGRSHWRLTLDTEQDHQFFLELGRRFKAPIETAGWRDIVQFIDANPELLRINTPT